MNVFIDTETTYTNLKWARDEATESIKAPANYKPETAAKWMQSKGAEKKIEAVKATSIDTSLAQIICIGFSVDGDQIQTMTGEEPDILREFFAVIENLRHANLIGHNIIEFDIPLIYHRAIINGVKPHPAFHMHYKAWDQNAFDTMIEWAGYRNRISLDKLCKLLDIPGKEDITGADVPGLYAAGEIDKIAAYCAEDVSKVIQIYQRLTQ